MLCIPSRQSGWETVFYRGPVFWSSLEDVGMAGIVLAGDLMLCPERQRHSPVVTESESKGGFKREENMTI